MKKCTTCGKEKELPEFWNEKRNKDGKRAYCIDCGKKDLKKSYIDNKEKRAEHAKEKYRKNPEGAKKRCKRWRERNPEKYHSYNKSYYAGLTEGEKENARDRKRKWDKSENGKEYGNKHRQGLKWKARYTLTNAIRDQKIEKGLRCILCNSEKLIEAHHPNYEKPLDVVWLCRECHRKIHKK